MPVSEINLIVNDSSPPYLQVADGLRREILAGSLPPHSRIPSVRDLAKELEMSPGTVKSAYKVLIDEGLLHSSVMGTFVSAGVAITLSRFRNIDESVSSFYKILVDKGFTKDEVSASFRRIAVEELV